MAAVEHETWLKRVQLLDDLPIETETRDLLGLAPLVSNLADTLLRGGGRPMVIHVDGAWGRGKTSFCRSLQARLEVPSAARGGGARAGSRGDRVAAGTLF